MGSLVADRGGQIRLGTRVLRVTPEPDGLVIATTAGELRARNLVNCAGLQSDRIARKCGLDPGLRIVPFRGEYYDFKPGRSAPVRHLVYPVPDPRFPFLGVHFTRMIHGGVEAGPNAVLALRRHGYRRCSASLRDILSFALYGGFWKMALKYWRPGLGEVWRSLSKRAFIKALRRLMPDLSRADVVRGGSGVRAQALLKSGKLADDFQIVEAKRMIHVLNAPSPAATASIAIGETIAQRAFDSFELD
jgi:L-2-hydroxyglutarate oxidase